MPYDHKAIEKKWQERYEQEQPFRAEDKSDKKKFYCLVEFPYPSGDGLHVGHVRTYTGLDVYSRKKRMDGYNVLFPIGWDAFGLPTENYALKTKRKPQDVTVENITTFRRQIKSLGLGLDWTREVNTTDPAYYKWTQWMFLKFFKAGLSYKAKMPINWCPSCKIGLANEEAVGGVCERCGKPVESREKEQWMIAITKYADRLLEGLKSVDYLPKIRKQQEDWIGRSEGASMSFRLNVPGQPNEKHTVSVFTTRPDTLFGATFLAVSPELAQKWMEIGWQPGDEVRSYVKQSLARSAEDRAASREKTGVNSGVTAVNPVNGETIPVWVADYVLGSYGSGAIMAVPAHDERDLAFAQKFGLPVRPVVAKAFWEPGNPPREGIQTVRRKTLHAIITRKTDGAVLLLKWKQNQRPDGAYPITFVIGGIEEGEDPIVTGQRECEEEAGLRNLRYVRTVPISVHTQYFAGHKNQNRYADITVMQYEAQGDEPFTVPAEELEKHEPMWVARDQVARELNITDGPYVWNQFERLSAMEDDGIAVNSGFLNDLPTAQAKEQMIGWLEDHGVGKRQVTYKLRDWVFSRQRYWGEPIPLVKCVGSCASEHGGWVPVPEADLPVKLPDVEKYQPSETGESPLAAMTDWVETTCPSCGGPARRETDTMPNWAGSSWYFLRYCDPKNSAAFASSEALAQWMPVDFYNGGMEHTVLHLLYSRFWNTFLFDQGFVPVAEPYHHRHSHGLVLAEDGEKMSKSRGNVVNPDEIVEQFGADTLRVFEMFLGPFEEAVPWKTASITGVRRFLERVSGLRAFVQEAEPLEVTRALHKTIKKVGEDIEALRFNTAVSAMMSFLNVAAEAQAITAESLELFLCVLSPFAPHLSNEIASELGVRGLLEHATWPSYDVSLVQDDVVEIAVQVNGKLRATVSAAPEADEAHVKALALAESNVQKFVEGKEIRKVIFVPGRLLNLVV